MNFRKRRTSIGRLAKIQPSGRPLGEASNGINQLMIVGRHKRRVGNRYVTGPFFMRIKIAPLRRVISTGLTPITKLPVRTGDYMFLYSIYSSGRPLGAAATILGLTY